MADARHIVLLEADKKAITLDFSTMGLRISALAALAQPSATIKCAQTQSLVAELNISQDDSFLVATAELPGRQERPLLVAPKALVKRSLQNIEGRAALIHALAHIELNAVNLALDILWRFPGLPQRFYEQWLIVAKEEALHFTLLNDHLNSLGYVYGDFPAHNSLWEMAEKTKLNLLARLALVPRTLEARGLDATPLVCKKLAGLGDKKGAAILDIILSDEVGHVATGNYWYRWECQRQGLDAVVTYELLARQYEAPRPHPPFNLEGRRAAGFTEPELQALEQAATQKDSVAPHS